MQKVVTERITANSRDDPQYFFDVAFALRHPHVSCHVMPVMKISRSYVQPSTRP